MTMMGRERNGTPPQEQPVHKIVYADSNSCTDYGLPGASKPYTYYIPASELPYPQEPVTANADPDRMNSFFKWKGRIYWEYSGAIFEPHNNDFVGTTAVCAIVTKTKQGDVQ